MRGLKAGQRAGGSERHGNRGRRWKVVCHIATKRDLKSIGKLCQQLSTLGLHALRKACNLLFQGTPTVNRSGDFPLLISPCFDRNKTRFVVHQFCLHRPKMSFIFAHRVHCFMANNYRVHLKIFIVLLGISRLDNYMFRHNEFPLVNHQEKTSKPLMSLVFSTSTYNKSHSQRAALIVSNFTLNVYKPLWFNTIKRVFEEVSQMAKMSFMMHPSEKAFYDAPFERYAKQLLFSYPSRVDFPPAIPSARV